MRKSFLKKLFIFFGLITLIGVTGYRIFMNSTIDEMKRKGFIPPVLAVEIIQPKEGPLHNTIDVIGDLQSDESVTLRPELPGKITKIAFEEGGYIQKGELCVALDDELYKAEVAQAKANLTLSQKNLARAQTLLAKQAGSEFTRDTAQRDLDVNKARLDLAESNLRKTKITAPFNGILGFRKASIGAYTSVGQDLVTIDAMDPIKVQFKLPEYTLSYLKLGQEIDLKVDAYPGEVFKGKIYAIDPKIGERTRNVSAKASISNTDYRLKPGLFARLHLSLSQKDKTLFLPESALVPMGQDYFVFTLVDGKAHFTQVKLGLKQGETREILEGITKDSQVVATGQHKLFEGLPIAPYVPEASK